MKVLTTPRSYGKTDPAVFEMLEKAGLEVIRNETGGILDQEAMKRLLAGCEGVIVGVDPLDAQVMAAAPRLRAIAKYGVGVDNIDLEAARARGIKVSRTVGANAEAVADYAMTLMLAVARRAAAIDARCRRGDWGKITTRDISGGVLGLLGLGAIGRLVARRAQGFGMTVMAYDPFWDEDYARANGIVKTSPEEKGGLVAGSAQIMGQNVLHMVLLPIAPSRGSGSPSPCVPCSGPRRPWRRRSGSPAPHSPG